MTGLNPGPFLFFINVDHGYTLPEQYTLPVLNNHPHDQFILVYNFVLFEFQFIHIPRRTEISPAQPWSFFRC